VAITESRNPRSAELDTMGVDEIVKLMNDEDKLVADAVELVLDDVAKAVELVVKGLSAGGRLVYAGAGTSGRLAMLDAAECPPTFGTPPEMVQVLMAGGEQALTRAQEGVEDDYDRGVADAKGLGLGVNDVVVGLSASGQANYVLGVVHQAKAAGAATVGISCNPGSALEAAADVAITPVVGPEVIMGSSRLKAGTAQKMILNMISTASMVKLGRVYKDLMIELKPANSKLSRRMKRIVSIAAGVDEEAATKLLEMADGDIRLAVVMGVTDLDVEEARLRLAAAGNNLRAALEAAN
jgi:N-acetylmuramic acid 6-phosphate etherase